MGSVLDLDKLPDYEDRCTSCNQNCYRDTSAMMHFGIAVSEAIADVSKGRLGSAASRFGQSGLGASFKAVIDEAGVIKKLAPRKAAPEATV
jgi:hypothetical protein